MTIAPKGLPGPVRALLLAQIWVSPKRFVASKISMKAILIATAPLILLVGCQASHPNPTPEQIRQDAAKATSAAVTDVKAAAQGVKDGLQKKEPVNLNTASLGDLETLPGVDDTTAQKILDRRPYDTPSDLMKKHVVSKDEYDRISDRVIAR
jgi:hypothetical protein